MATWVGYPAAYTKGRNRPVQYVVIHTTEGGEGPTAAEDGAHYDKIRMDGTSTHIFVDQNTALREVPDADRANAARYHGNEIGLQVELCGVAAQTWAQWHDGASTSELRLAAREVAQMCADHGIPPVHLSVAQVRAAYYAPVGQRPKGICAHNDVTGAYPEDAGTHTDPGPDFPWAEFLAMVAANLAGGGIPASTTEEDFAMRMVRTPNGSIYVIEGYNRATRQPYLYPQADPAKVQEWIDSGVPIKQIGHELTTAYWDQDGPDPTPIVLDDVTMAKLEAGAAAAAKAGAVSAIEGATIHAG